MIETFEEISRALVDSGIIVVQRKLFVPKNIYNFVGIPEEELVQERIENNGRTLSELHTLIRMNLSTFGEFTVQRAELKIKGLQTASNLIFNNPYAIKTTLLSKLYMEIEDWICITEDLMLETNEPIIWDYIQLLNETKKKIIDLENKVENSHLKTNLMIDEYKNQLLKIKNDKIGSINYSGTLNYIDIK